MKIRSAKLTSVPSLAGIAFLTVAIPASARDYFDPGLLALTGGQSITTDLSAFETAGHIPPGSYLVTLIVNQVDLGQHQLMFKADQQGKTEPELTPEFLHKVGVNTKALPAFVGLPPDEVINSINELIPEARVNFDFAQQRLELSIPQIAMQANTQGAIDPALWDHGVPALLFNFSANGGRNWQDGQYDGGNTVQTNLFANVRGGLNWQAWRLRSNMTYIYNQNSGGSNTDSQSNQQTQFSNTYLQRDIAALRSEILVGESNTENDVFDSIPFQGGKLNSSDDMLPTRHYYSFADFNSQGHQLSEGQVPWALERQRSNFQVQLNQQLGSWGSAYLSSQRSDFWGNDKVMNSVSAGYNGSYRGVSYGLAYSINRVKGDGNWPEDRQLSLNTQVPLSLLSNSSSVSNTYARYQMTHNNQGQVQQQAGISGSALDDRLSYSAMQGWSNGNADSTSSLNAGYQGSKGMANMSYSHGSQSRSLNMGGNGAVVVHPGGVTLSQMLGALWLL